MATRAQAIQELKKRGSWGYYEPLLTMGSAILAEPISGLAGLATLPFGHEKSTQVINRVQDAMTYQPRIKEGQQFFEEIAPVGEKIDAGLRYLGDKTLDATGSPLLAAGAYSFPVAGLELLGAKGASKIPGKPYQMGDIGTQASKIGGRQRGIFAGIKAKQADLIKMEAAKELQKRGIPRREIWEQTGWFEDIDGGWKFEIDDSGMQTIPRKDWSWGNREDYAFGSGAVGPLDEFIKHDELAANYDGLLNFGDADKRAMMRVTGHPGGSYSPDTDTIRVQGSGVKDDVVADKSIAAHEIQHAIQQREGFALGGDAGNTLKIPEVRKEIVKRFESKRGSLPAVKDAKARMTPEEYEDFAISHYAGEFQGGDQHMQFELYRQLAGEAEARNVQARLNMTPEERAKTPPWETRAKDVPEDELIVARGRGVAQSVDSVDELSDKIKDMDGIKTLNLFEDRKGDIKLDTIIVDKSSRSSGVGTKAMEEIIDYADKNNRRVKLTPAVADDFQGTTSQARLKRFYRRFGFVENKGRNKDFEISELMYRDPQ